MSASSSVFTKRFGSRNQRTVKRARKVVDGVNALEAELEQLTDEQLQAKTTEFRERLSNGETLDSLQDEAFAAIREAGKRVLGMPGDVVRHEGDAVFINGRKVASLLKVTRLGVPLTRGPEGVIPEGCYYTGTSHPRGLDSRYGEIGFVCRGQILGSGRTIL